MKFITGFEYAALSVEDSGVPGAVGRGVLLARVGQPS
jgi:hypothetical protein